MKKKIVFVIDSLNSGGAEKSLVSLLNLFNYKKYDVHLMLINKSGLYLPLVPKEVTIIDPPNFFTFKPSLKSFITINEFKYNIARIKQSLCLRLPIKRNFSHVAQLSWNFTEKAIDKLESKYDVAIAYSQGFPTYFVASKVSANKKYCWINTDYKKAGYNKEFDYKYYEVFDKLIAVSDVARDVLVEVYPEFKNKITVIYDIISKNLICKMADKEIGFKDNFDGLRILTIGRLVKLKGYDIAIKVAKKLKDDGINFRWYSIGEGIFKKELLNLVKENNLEDNFYFLGTFTNPYPFIKECDIYCQPSRFEGFGMAIAEAKILKKPIVTTNFTIVHNQIKNNENGIIVDINDEALYKGIKKIISNNKLKYNLIKNLDKEKISTEDEIFKIYSMLENTC
ncbi:glycosyltransferase [Clostridium tarantellae]|uniref:glycosyltransferase n=1 Tax=Clostridium tarantellae TaxID=39493 RepID=UPI001A9B8749|nr:glycosyltransferase [Clostridium tarantellae]